MDPWVGSLGKLKATTHCLSTAFVRRKGQCSLSHDDEDIRVQLGPFRVYSRLHKGVVVCFLLVSRRDQDLVVDYGLHPKCAAVWKGMVKRLLKYSQHTIVVHRTASAEVESFLVGIGYVQHKNTLVYNNYESKDHHLRIDRPVAGPSGDSHVRGGHARDAASEG